MVVDLLRELGVEDEAIIAWMKSEAERFDIEDMSETVMESAEDAVEAA